MSGNIHTRDEERERERVKKKKASGRREDRTEQSFCSFLSPTLTTALEFPSELHLL